ncbi:MAG: hypothetical protein ACT4QA_01955 [Panacagrimonas sp.]
MGMPVFAEPRPYAQQRLKLSGSLSMGAASSNRELNDDRSIAVPRVSLKLTQALAPGVYFRYDLDAASRDAHGGGDAVALREAFLNYSDGPLDLRIGVQTIAWGRTDILNPTDNLTPYRYTWLGLTDGDQRVGSFAARASYRTPVGQVTGVVLPLFRPSLVPLGDTGPVRVREIKPEEPVGAYGLKLERQGSSLEWSISYFRGHSLRPNLVPAPDFADSLVLNLRHPRVDILGVDFAMPWRSLILRGEAAYTRADECCDFAGIELRKSDNAFAVLGMERALGAWRLVSQAFHKQNFDDAARPRGVPPLLGALARGSDILNEEARPAYSGLSVGAYPASLGTRFSASVDAAWIVQTHDYVLRPRLTLILRDDVSINLAADLYGGDEEGPLGLLGDNSLVMANVQFSFSREWGR